MIYSILLNQGILESLGTNLNGGSGDLVSKVVIGIKTSVNDMDNYSYLTCNPLLNPLTL